jgi:hypothetical protein
MALYSSHLTSDPPPTYLHLISQQNLRTQIDLGISVHTLTAPKACALGGTPYAAQTTICTGPTPNRDR